MNNNLRNTLVGGLLCMGASAAPAVPLTLTQLTGVTGGSPAETAVFKADLSSAGLGSILSISIRDSDSGAGGASGQFSGFDLDGIKLSLVDCADATCAASAAAESVFDFSGGALFSPGTQRPIADPKLFGTGPLGTTVDNTVATLGLFDGNSTTSILADGFMSLGDGGIITFNLTAATSTTGLFLYIGEVGNNGEVAASSIEISSSRVPLPGTLALLGLGLVPLAVRLRHGK
jgi:hypothetical protein